MTEENLKRIYGAYTLTEDEMNFILEDNQVPGSVLDADTVCDSTKLGKTCTLVMMPTEGREPKAETLLKNVLLKGFDEVAFVYGPFDILAVPAPETLEGLRESAREAEFILGHGDRSFLVWKAFKKGSRLEFHIVVHS